VERTADQIAGSARQASRATSAIADAIEDGVEVVKAIARVPRDADDKPLTPVVLRKVTIVQDGAPIPPRPISAPDAKIDAAPAGQPK